MIIQLPYSLLAIHLQRKEPSLYGEACQLRNQVQKWLEYIPSTFPHYTTHTIEHSDSIINNLSALLFDQQKASPSLMVPLSPMEIFILLASAYLHDSGMVASDSEKLEIIRSPDWRRWIHDQRTREEELAEIEQLRTAPSSYEEDVRNFAADLCLRHLIAEYIRGRHHLRAAEVIKAHAGLFTPFLARSKVLAQTVADICVSHGLDRYELENARRFPESRTIANQKVNVRFMAILLRIGDLLDMSTERACPLLINAACPLPPESYAHWAQYEGIEHFDVTPQKIELRAACTQQNSHRFLHDWCTWLVREVRNAGGLMGYSTRHSSWKAPRIGIDTEDASILIAKAPTATYQAYNWHFELDRDEVLDRVIFDVYEHPLDFLRELLQNACDATRCRIYDDLRRSTESLPNSPTRISDQLRSRFPISITLASEPFLNERTNKTEQRQVLSINDFGIGMDADIRGGSG